MNIGILTYYNVPNFGANLQALSTCFYLQKQGHVVTFLYYISHVSNFYMTRNRRNVQALCHFQFIDEYLPNQTEKLHSAEDIKKAIKKYKLEGIIIGSDAVLQHHPLFSTLKLNGIKRWLWPIESERRYPNAYWGCGFSDIISVSMFSVSSQNSPYKKFLPFTKNRMAKSLARIKFLSVRDEWTKMMVERINPTLQPVITPDPVFALNQNLDSIIPTEKDIRCKFGLTGGYVLISMRSQALSFEQLNELKTLFDKQGKTCVAFPITSTRNYKHPFVKEISLPLTPLDWYALLKYSSAYIGSNMHPIVVSLHNAVPCYSLDNWGTTNFWGHKIKDGSSKVYDILKRFGIEGYRAEIENGVCDISVSEIFAKLCDYPVAHIKTMASLYLKNYNTTMKLAVDALVVK